MSNIKKKAEAIRAFLVPFIELAGALETVADLSADEQRLKEATSEITSMHHEAERLKGVVKTLQDEVKSQEEKKAEIINSASAEAKRIVGAAVAESKRIKDEAIALANKSIDEATKESQEHIAKCSAAEIKRKEIEQEIEIGEKKLADIRAKIANIVAGI